MSSLARPRASERIRVLIAEDSPTQADHLRFLLEENGFEVTAARNGAEALELARTIVPNLVISDILMPEMDGYELCRSLKSDSRTAGIPVVLVTELSSPNNVFKGLDAGADNFIIKPYEETLLLNRITYLLTNRLLRRSDKTQVGIEIELSGQRHFITAERQQILDLLISTYDQAVRLNEGLEARQRELARSFETLHALYGIADGLNRCRTELEVAENAIRCGLRLPGVHAGWMFVREGGGFRLAAEGGAVAAAVPRRALGETCSCQRRLLDGGLVAAANIEGCEWLSRPGLAQDHASVPLLADGEPIGLLILLGDGQHRFSEEELRTLTSVGNQIAVALARARLHAALERQVEERTRALQAEVVERRHAELVATTARHRLLDAIESLNDGFVLYDREDRLQLSNARYAELMAAIGTVEPGIRFAELLRMVVEGDLLDIPGDDREAFLAERLAMHATAAGQPIVVRQRSGRWLQASERRTREGGIVGVYTDITDLKSSQQALAVRLEQQAALAHLGRLALARRPLDEFLGDAAGILREALAVDFVAMLERVKDVDGLRLRAGSGWPPGVVEAGDPIDPASPAAHALAGGEPVVVTDWEIERRFTCPGILAEHGVRSSLVVAIPGPEGPFGMLGVESTTPRDFTADDVNVVTGFANVIGSVIERLHYEQGLREANDVISTILDASPVAIVTLDREGSVLSWNRSAENTFGYAADEVLGKPCPLLPPDLEENLRRSLMTVRAGQVIQERTTQCRRRDGARLDVRLSAEPLYDGTGAFRGGVFTFEDITARLKVEQQLRQAQKMEAIGNLTGGIAHDFNNLLTIVMGNLDLLQDELRDRPAAAEMADIALQASIRGAALTRQLLAFARRQDLLPTLVDVNELVRGMVKLLRRILGEEIVVRLVETRDLWPVVVDAAQLDTSIVNLALNARDAMPSGGNLTIETENRVVDENFIASHPRFSPGDYVTITVTDTGTGMAPEVLGRVFEPFFTTKEINKGTGLGLAMVYGFVTQSGGQVTVYSEIGKGTSFRLYLPRARAEAAGETAAGPELHAPHAVGDCRVLVAEDSDEVRRMVTQQLLSFGYRVHAVANAADALAHLETGARVDLLFSDVVMPGPMTGLDLALLVRERWPEVRVLLTSGFPKGALLRTDAADNFEILSKPYRKHELAQRLREVLAR